MTKYHRNAYSNIDFNVTLPENLKVGHMIHFQKFSYVYNALAKIENANTILHRYTYGVLFIHVDKISESEPMYRFTLMLQNLHSMLEKLESTNFANGLTADDMKLINFVYRQLRLRKQIEKSEW